MHPPVGGWGSLRWEFILGIILAAGGGTLVTLYKPPAAPVAKIASPVAPAPVAPPASP